MKKAIKLLLIILCMISIFFLSSENADKSTKKSNYVIVKVTESFFGRKLNSKEKNYYINRLVKFVRKTAHFSLYFLLGLFTISFLIEYMPLSIKSIIIAVSFIFLYACSDEIHQLFIPGRSGEVLDVLIDTSGGIFSIILYNYFAKLRRKFNESKKRVS